MKYSKAIMLLVALPGIVFTELAAQDATQRKTIDITSSFKPTLRTPEKFGFTASAAPTDSTRPRLSYSIPVDQLAFAYHPSPLKPLAFQPDSIVAHNSVFLKAGYGNFKTPLLQAVAGFGNSGQLNGRVAANYLGSEGKLPYQQFRQYGVNANLGLPAGTKHQLKTNVGYQGFNTYRYGFGSKTELPPEDSLKLNYYDGFLGAAFENVLANAAGIDYRAEAQVHFFGDNDNAKETSFDFNVPLSKTVNERLEIGLGIQGMIAKFDNSTLSFKNNWVMLPVSASFPLQENIRLKAGLIPSWNNDEFKLLPDVMVEYKKPESSLNLQAGFRGYLTSNTFRSLATTNPWMMQPVTSFTNSRTAEFFAGVKSDVNEQISFGVTAAIGKQYHVPLFVNDKMDGRSFAVVSESQLSRTNITGEFIYKPGKKFYWSTQLSINGYSNLKTYEKAYGLLPFELNSSLRLRITEDLRIKTDLYAFNGAWYQHTDGSNDRGKSAIDLNAGIEFDIAPKLRLWLDFNNIINQDYQRWNQYRVLGFQAIGGLVFHL